LVEILDFLEILLLHLVCFPQSLHLGRQLRAIQLNLLHDRLQFRHWFGQEIKLLLFHLLLSQLFLLPLLLFRFLLPFQVFIEDRRCEIDHELQPLVLERHETPVPFILGADQDEIAESREVGVFELAVLECLDHQAVVEKAALE
jgi:hypothetical protein